jgi:hypothetical protein
LAGSDYSVTNNRVGLDGVSSITWQIACDGDPPDITGWDTANKAIISVFFQSTVHNPDPESFNPRWRNVTDSGSFATLVTGSGELRAGTSAGAITNGDPVGGSAGCQTTEDDEEVENESPLLSKSFDMSQNAYGEIQFCVDFSNALTGKEYEFELYSNSAGASCGTLSITITTAAPSGSSEHDSQLQIYEDSDHRSQIQITPFSDHRSQFKIIPTNSIHYSEFTIKGWLSTSWWYRKEHTINGTAVGAQTDYNIPITVHYGAGSDSGQDVYCDSKCKTDFGDLRFTLPDGVTALDYWIESKTDSDKAEIWVKLNNIPASPDSTTIYVYFGNSGVSTTSNFGNTFPVFNDDFEDDDVSDWTIGGSGTWDTTSTYAHDGTYGAGGLGATSVVAEKPMAFSETGEIRIWHYPLESSGKNYILTEGDGTPNWNNVYVYHDSAIDKYQYYDGTINDIATSVAGDNWYFLVIRFDVNAGTYDVYVYNSSLTLQGSILGADMDDIPANIIHTMKFNQGSGAAGEGYQDTVAVRKYVSPEPTHSTWGTLEEIVSMHYSEFEIIPPASSHNSEFVIGPSASMHYSELVIKGWLSNWDYRKRHEIDGTSSGAQVDYQVPITVHYGSGADSGDDVYCDSLCKTDFGDIRFTKSDGVTALDYWMQTKTDSNQAIFWVKVNTIPASPDSTDIYVYWGNSGVSTTSSITNTFPFFNDDFEDNLDQWTLTGTPTISSDQSYEPQGSNSAKIDDASTGQKRADKTVTEQSDKSVVAWFYDDASKTASTWGNLVSGWDGTTFCGIGVQTFDGETDAYTYRIGGTYNDSLVSRSTGWHKFEMAFDGTDVRLYIDDSIISTDPDPDTLTNLRFGNSWTALQGIGYVDAFIVRQYANPEPTHGTWGALEEQVSGHYSELEIRPSESVHSSELSIYVPESTHNSELLIYSISEHRSQIEIIEGVVESDHRSQLYIYLEGSSEHRSQLQIYSESIHNSELYIYEEGLSDHRSQLFIYYEGSSDHRSELYIYSESSSDHRSELQIYEISDHRSELYIYSEGLSDHRSEFFIYNGDFSDHRSQLYIYSEGSSDHRSELQIYEISQHNSQLQIYEISDHRSQLQVYDTGDSDHRSEFFIYLGGDSDHRSELYIYSEGLSDHRSLLVIYDTGESDHRSQLVIYDTGLSDHRSEFYIYEEGLSDHRSQLQVYEISQHNSELQIYQISDHRSELLVYGEGLSDHRSEFFIYLGGDSDHRSELQIYDTGESDHRSELFIYYESLSDHRSQLQVIDSGESDHRSQIWIVAWNVSDHRSELYIYEEGLSDHRSELLVYGEGLSDHRSQLQIYDTDESDHRSELYIYSEGLSDHRSQILIYSQSIHSSELYIYREGLSDYRSELQIYDIALSDHRSELQIYDVDLSRYDSQLVIYDIGLSDHRSQLWITPISVHNSELEIFFLVVPDTTHYSAIWIITKESVYQKRVKGRINRLVNIRGKINRLSNINGKINKSSNLRGKIIK